VERLLENAQRNSAANADRGKFSKGSSSDECMFYFWGGVERRQFVFAQPIKYTDHILKPSDAKFCQPSLTPLTSEGSAQWICNRRFVPFAVIKFIMDISGHQ